MGQSAPQPGECFHPFLTRCHALKTRKGTKLVQVTNHSFTFLSLTLSLRVPLPQRKDQIQTGITFIITSSASRTAKEQRTTPDRKSVFALVAVALLTRAARACGYTWLPGPLGWGSGSWEAAPTPPHPVPIKR